MFNDRRLLLRLQDGYTVHLSTYETGLRWLVENWPNGIDWPTGTLYPAEWKLRSALNRRQRRPKKSEEERARLLKATLERKNARLRETRRKKKAEGLAMEQAA